MTLPCGQSSNLHGKSTIDFISLTDDMQQSLHYNEYRMPQRVSSLACRHATTLVRHCWSCIGCRYTIESSSSWVFWCTWHTTDSHRCTLATLWRQSVAYHLVGDYALLTQQTTWCQGHVLSSKREHSVFSGLWSGTLSPSHCELSIPSPLFVAGWRLTFLTFTYHDFKFTV